MGYMGGSYNNVPKAIFYLLKGDYMLLEFRVEEVLVRKRGFLG